MRNSQEMCLDGFGRINIIPINRPHETVLYVRKLDGSIEPRYKSTATTLQTED